MLAAHPFGIGRGVFQRVFPVYRTIKGTMAVRFEFIENEPLQYLVETGWLGFLALMIISALVAREWIRGRRADPVEAALVAALVAVLVHNLFDFGLETLGIQIPFAAVLGTLLGRSSGVDRRVISFPRTASILAVGLVAMVIGAGSVVHASSREFDSQLEKAARAPAPVRRELALRAEAAHPVDYYYATGAGRGRTDCARRQRPLSSAACVEPCSFALSPLSGNSFCDCRDALVARTEDAGAG